MEDKLQNMNVFTLADGAHQLAKSVTDREWLELLIASIHAPVIRGVRMTRGDKTYDEGHSAMCPLKKGKNVIHFKVDQDVIDPLRLDPSYTLGEYTIESIIARTIL